jgi:hypothetical protein
MAGIDPSVVFTDSSGKKVTGQDLINMVKAEAGKLSQQTRNVTDPVESYTIKSVWDISGITTAYVNTITSGFNLITESIQTLDVKGTQIMSTLGTTRSRLSEFKSVYAEALPSFTEMGVEDDPATVFTNIASALGGAASIGVEAMTEIAATSKVTGIEVTTLAQNFRNVGVSIYDVGDAMEEVVDYTRSVGGNVSEVTKLVTTNLEKLNLYNFSNGVAGLTKMAVQAARLGIDMNSVFETSEKLLNPEAAIEMAAGLQRLGVANSEMLDPLRLMDMGLNGPDELMKSMTDLSKEFVQLNEKGQFEIMPGAKRRMREVAQELGMSAAEFSKLAIKSADFDRKLQEIRMPSFVGDDETRELIATMSQIKDGKSVITVTDDKTGVSKEVEVDQLTPQDIENLRLSEEDRGKTMEEIALDQRDYLKQINFSLQATGQRIGMAGAITPPAQRAFDFIGESQLNIAKGAKDITSFKDINKEISEITQPFENIIFAVANNDFGKVDTELKGLFNTLANLETTYKEKITNAAKTFYGEEIDLLKKTYSNQFGTPVGATSGQQNATGTGTQQQSSSQTVNPLNTTNTNLTPPVNNARAEINNNLKIDINVNIDPGAKNMDLTDTIKRTVIDVFSDNAVLSKMAKYDPNSGLLQG